MAKWYFLLQRYAWWCIGVHASFLVLQACNSIHVPLVCVEHGAQQGEEGTDSTW